MRPLPYNSGLGKGKIGELFDLILERLRASEPAASPGTLYTKSSRGVSRIPRQRGASAALVIQELTVQQEGADALLCTNAASEEIWVMKPYILRSTLWSQGGPQGGANFGWDWDTGGDQETHWVGMGFILNNSASWGTEHLRIWPPYTWSTPGAGAWPTYQIRPVDAGSFDHTIMCGKLASPVAINGNNGAIVPSVLDPTGEPDTDVEWIDLNVSGRIWKPFSSIAASHVAGGDDVTGD